MGCNLSGFPTLHCLLNLLKLIHIESVMPSNHLMCCSLLLPSIFPSVRVFSKKLVLHIFPSIRVFSNELVLHIRWPKDWSFSFSNSPSNEYSGLVSFRIYWFGLLAIQRTNIVTTPKRNWQINLSYDFHLVLP